MKIVTVLHKGVEYASSMVQRKRHAATQDARMGPNRRGFVTPMALFDQSAFIRIVTASPQKPVASVAVIIFFLLT
jgi:hypothetical protein